MNSYLIIADDFTGANDTGVQIRRRGILAKVMFTASGIDGGESCVLNTETRFLPEAEAYQKLREAAQTIPFGSFRHVIKKVDSTLRGNIGAETKALCECYQPDVIIFAPAFPDLGRTTLKRVHCLNGTPISQSEPAQDLKTPVKVDDIHEIMSAAFKEEKVVHVDLETLNGGSFDIRSARVFCFDALTNNDLQTIARLVLAPKKRVLWVGSAGLVDNLLNVENVTLPALAVVASLSSVTRSQVHFAGRHGVSFIKVPFYAILEKTTELRKFAGEAAALLEEGKDVILLSSSAYSTEEFEKAEEGARRAGFSTGELSAFTRQMMGKLAVQVLEKAKVSGLFLTGGDTAMSCFEHAGALGSHIEGEIAIGLPLVRLIGGPYEGLKVVTKAGAFGNEDAIYYGLRKLREVR